eukprot:TRINITY_DN2794_c0_g1_i1.p1 TRINITY_DN2794_c0_g1~~TRINITY_DN2794_c0_g1_i1.p1  ORF type:complete len:154 (+),score=50.25 TRINITY_DN2794_c0_g1_i1:32-463(+)
MSKARKHVTSRLKDDSSPELGESEVVARVTELRGTQLEVETGGERILVNVPSKFSRYVFIKRGNFVIIHKADFTDPRFKVRGILSNVLTASQVKQMKKDKTWPAEFEDPPAPATDAPSADDYMLNPNHMPDEDDEDEDGNDED